MTDTLIVPIPPGIAQGSNLGGGIPQVQDVKQGVFTDTGTAKPTLYIPNQALAPTLSQDWSLKSLYIPFGLLLATNPASTQPTKYNLLFQLHLSSGRIAWADQINDTLVATSSTSNWVANGSLQADLFNAVPLNSGENFMMKTILTLDQGATSSNLGINQQVTGVSPGLTYTLVPGSATFELDYR